MLAAVVAYAAGGLEGDLFLCFDGDLFSGMGIETCALALVLDEESAEVGDGDFFLLLAQAVRYDAENGIHGCGGLGLALASALCHGRDKFASVHRMCLAEMCKNSKKGRKRISYGLATIGDRYVSQSPYANGGKCLTL